MNITANYRLMSKLDSKLDSISATQATILHQNQALASQNATLITQNAELCARVAALELRAGSHDTASDLCCEWRCPVCHETFKHRESFKGHIRRLVYPSSSKSACFLDESKPEHVALVSHPRYNDGDGMFPARAASFSLQLYETVKSNSTSRTTSESSHRAVRIVRLQLIPLLMFAPQIHDWLSRGSAVGGGVVDVDDGCNLAAAGLAPQDDHDAM